MAALALLAACPPGHALGGGKRDFVSGPWRGFTMFDSEQGRYQGCTAGWPSGDKPWLVWNFWGDGAEVVVRNAPWILRKGQGFPARLSVDDARHADARAEVTRGSDANRPSILRIVPQDVAGLLRRAAAGRKLTVELGDKRRLSFSLAGTRGMLASLDRCHRRGVALQRKADESVYKASDLFVAQEDAEAFARWADNLSRLAHLVTTVVGLGDGVRVAVEQFSGRGDDPRLLKFALRFGLTPAEQAMERVRRGWAELEPFESASGTRGLSEVLRELTQKLLNKAEDMLRDAQGLWPAMSKGDRKETRRLYSAIARVSYLSYAGDTVYLVVRNASRAQEDLEYHLNRASQSINLMNVALINPILFLPDDALADKMPALIAESNGHIHDARRWARSGREILQDRLAEILLMEDSPASRDRIALLGLYARSLDEEEALADRFEAASEVVEAALSGGAPLSEIEYRSLVHGGERTAAALLQGRFALRLKRGAAHETFEGR